MKDSDSVPIGVTQKTIKQSPNLPSIASARFVPLPAEAGLLRESDLVVALWRRQQDPTAWVKELLPMLPRLAWLHTDTVGVERLPLRELHDRGIVLTNARGAFATPMAEWALCIMLTCSKRIPQFLAAAHDGVWASDISPSDFANQTVLILGYGSVGRELSRVCRVLGQKVICVRRTAAIGESYPSGVTVLSADEDWRAFLSTADFLVLALPLTTETRGMINNDVLAQLRSGARLINVGRAEVLDEDAVIEALRNGTLAEAWLDVFAVEPLPSGHRFWHNPKIYITPHKSAVGESNESSTRLVFQRQLAQFVQGKPLLHQIDLLRGY